MDLNGHSNGKQASPNGKARTKHKANQPISTNGAAAPPPFAKKKVTNRKISSLRPHPKQEFFPDLPPDELNRLAESMKRRLDEAIEILPDGTIISGHQRVKAAKLLGWKEIRCWVRHDLAEQGAEAVERRLIEANFHRRQLSPLEKARCFRRLLELERDKPRRNGELKGDLRDYLAGQFGYSGRNLERWVKVLDTPLEIQQAVTGQKLKLEVGEDVAALPKETQDEIASKIREGAEPKQAVAEHLMATVSQPGPDTAYRRLRRNLEQVVPVLANGFEDVYLRYRRRDLPLLRRGNKVLAKLIARIEKMAKEESPETEKQLAALLAQGKSKSRAENRNRS
jgi:ParB-like chromosome segregation protein Spo0J